MADLQQAAQWVREATRIVVLSGAGLSTDSGIPDFRGPNGLWTRNPACTSAFATHPQWAPTVRLRQVPAPASSVCRSE